MARFNLTAQLTLQAPSSSNVNSTLSTIQNQLGRGVNVQVNITGGAAAVSQLQRIQRQTQATINAAEQMGAAFGASLKRFAAFAVATRAVSLLTNNLGDAIDTSIEFQRQIVKIGQITGKSEAELNPLVNTIQTLAKTLGVASNELAGIADTLAQAGLSAHDTEIALTALAKTKLAPSFGKITDTVEGAIAIMAQFGKGANALEQQLGAVNEVAAKFAVESQDLITVIRTAGGVFKASGGSLEELLALFTSVRATTRESAESISTGLRTIFTRIQRPETISNLKKIGIELTDLKGRFVGPYEAVKRLNDVMKTLGERDPRFIQISEQLGGFRQIGKVIPLLQQFEIAEKARQAALSGGNSLNKAAEEGQKALAVQIAKVHQEFQNLVNDIVRTDSFQIFVKTSLSLASALIKVGDAIKPLIPLIGAFAAIKLGQGIAGFASGIGAELRHRNGGGPIGFATGGLVPGHGNTDTVPAMLTPGEFVIKKSSVASIGAGNLHAMNHYSGGTSKEGVQPFRSTGGNTEGMTLKEAITALKNKTFGKKGKLLNPRALVDAFGQDAVDAALGGNAVERNRSGPTEQERANAAAGNIIVMKPNAVGGFFLQNESSQTEFDQQINSKGNDVPGNAKRIRGKIFAGILHTDAATPLRENIGRNVHQAILQSVQQTAEKLNVKPLEVDGAITAKDAVDKIDMKSVEGHVFEAYLSHLTNTPLTRAEKSSDETFDFKQLNANSKSKLSVLFGAKVPDDTVVGDIKRTLNAYSIADIKDKIVNEISLGHSSLVEGKDYKIVKPETTKALPGIEPQGHALGGLIQKFNEGGGVYSVSSDNTGFSPKIVQELLGKVKEGTRVNFVIGPAGSGKSTLTSKLGAAPLLNPADIDSAKSLIFESASGKLDNILGMIEKTKASGGFGILLDKDASVVDSQRQARVAAKVAGTHHAFDKRSEAALAATAHAPKTVDKAFIEALRAVFPALQIEKFAGGGGAHGTDTVPAMLTPGEFVIKKSAAQKIGYNNLDRMNRKGYAHGGVVGFNTGGGVFGGGTGAAIALTAIPVLLSSLSQLTSKIEGVGKIVDSFATGLTLAIVQTYGFYKATKAVAEKSETVGNNIIRKQDAYTHATNQVNTSKLTNSNDRADVFAAFLDHENQVDNLSRYGRRKFNRNTQRIPQLQSNLAALQEQQKNNPLSFANGVGINTAVANAQKAIDRNARQINNLVPAYNALNAAQQKAAASAVILKNNTDRANSLTPKFGEGRGTGKFLSGVGGALNFASKAGGYLTAAITGAQAVNGVGISSFEDATEQDVQHGDYKSARANFAETQRLKDRTSVLGATGSIADTLNVGRLFGVSHDYFSRQGSEYTKSIFGDKEGREAKEALAQNIISASTARAELAISDKKSSAEGRAINVVGQLNARREAIKDISNPIAQKQALEQADADVLKFAHGLLDGASSIEEMTKISDVLVGANKNMEKQIRQITSSMVSQKEAQDALTKANFDATKVNTILGAGALRVENFLKSLETGSSSLDAVVTTLEAAQHNSSLSGEGLASSRIARNELLNTVGDKEGSGTVVSKAITDLFNRFDDGLNINKQIGQHLDTLKITPGDTAAAVAQAQAHYGQFTKNPEILSAINSEIDKAFKGVEHPQDVPLDKLNDSIQKVVFELSGSKAVDLIKQKQKFDEQIITLTQRRIQAEEKLIEAQKKAVDLQAEAAQVAHEFGAAIVTPQQKSAFNVAKFNIGNENLGLGNLSSGSGDELAGVARQITERFAALQNEADVAASKGGGAFQDAAGAEEDVRAQLVKKNEELIETTRAQIAVKREELELIRKKNQLEKDSLDKLLGGDIEGFLRGQQASAAGSAIRSGNTSLVSSFSSSSLGEALKNAREIGLPPDELQKFSRAALGSVGINDQRAIQVASGTTAEEQRANAEGRRLAAALGTAGTEGAKLQQMNVTAQDVIIQAAHVNYESSLSKSANFVNGVPGHASGGMIYAAAGQFVPRGTDTVPAMLSPGEYVVNSRAVANGNNRQVLEAMNHGGGNGISAEIASSLSNSLGGFVEAVNKLAQLKISVKLDPVHVNVNLSNASMLGMLSDQVKKEVLAEVGEQIKNIKFNNAGEVSPRNTVL